MSEQLNPFYPILIVDDNVNTLTTLKELLTEKGFTNIKLCNDSLMVEKLVAEQQFALILLDLFMPGFTGEDLLPMIKQATPEVPVIIVTISGDVDSAVRCMKKGAYDYILKDKAEEYLLPVLYKALELVELRSLNSKLRKMISSPAPQQAEYPEHFSRIITQDSKMLHIFEYIEMISRSSETVLITGESGTGKELIAEAIHKASGRKGEFVAFNVAGVDDFLFADTLFGHIKGAFTGADKDRQGLVAKAEGGTLFLDEIGDTGLDAQQKLLRLLETREFLPLGADAPRISNAKVIVATNKNIPKLIKEKKFRHDLYYRLDLHAIHLPPLRERKEDIPLLIDYFVEEAAKKNNKEKPLVPASVYELLTSYHFPGNIRKLRSLIFEAVIINKTGELSYDYFDSKLVGAKPVSKDKSQAAKLIFSSALPSLQEVQLLLLEETLKRTSNNLSHTARMLGVSRPTIVRLKKMLDKRRNAAKVT